MEINRNNVVNIDEDLSYKQLIKQSLIALIKSKHEGFDDSVYESMLKNFSLLKDDDGIFHIVTPTSGAH